ncbi:MAG: peptidylprolyl isomerase [Alphaproteobacteria bacterium]|nr:peptidylprolyl isomerase [Alphaproteobacteria bacterium]|tara:strand:- start:3054 stop:3935 length:882 start_codon:yes stop_codon:yes gene_type:complete
MIRIFTAAFAAIAMLAACSGDKAPADLDATFAKYLPWDADNADVQEGYGGLQYIVLHKGDGDATPKPTDLVRVNYEGRTAGGEKFDSSYDRGSPAMFRLNQVIPGWTQGLQQMHEGDVFLFYIPNALAYGNQDRGPVIKAGDDLVFQVELVEIMEPKSADAEAWEKYTPWNPDLPEVKKTESGLQYVVLESGDPAGESPKNGEMVAVYYEGRLAETGEMFDSAFERGQPELFPSDRLIRGWVEALSMMKPGDHWLMYIPSDIAYGEKGTPGGPIPPNADLMFEVELLDVIKQN